MLDESMLELPDIFEMEFVVSLVRQVALVWKFCNECAKLD